MSERIAFGFVIDRQPFREHDLRVDLLLDDGDRVEALCPSGQRSKQRYAGGLSPLALHRFGLTKSARGQRLDDARIERAWPPLLADLTRQTASLAAVATVREVAVPSPGDHVLFLLLGELFAQVAEAPTDDTAGHLVRFVFETLTHVSHAPVLDRCVRCGTHAPAGALTTLDLQRGAVVCRPCGGGDWRLAGHDRTMLLTLARGGSLASSQGAPTLLATIIQAQCPQTSDALRRADVVFQRSTR
jgi:recombinational DNA repair protein (RecF pathway)